MFTVHAHHDTCHGLVCNLIFLTPDIVTAVGIARRADTLGFSFGSADSGVTIESLDVGKIYSGEDYILVGDKAFEGSPPVYLRRMNPQKVWIEEWFQTKYKVQIKD